MKNILENSGLELIEMEHNHNRLMKGWTENHDCKHTEGELASAAAVYALYAAGFTSPDKFEGFKKGKETHYDEDLNERYTNDAVLPIWPFKESPNISKENDLKCLIKAGALILAEIERLQNRYISRRFNGFDIKKTAERLQEYHE